MDKKNPKISIILSFYNEINNLPELIFRLRNVCSLMIQNKKIKDYELIFINDDSNDGSEEYLTKEIEFGDVILINMSRNFGVTECTIAGMAYSTGDAVVYLDTDLQDPPEVIPLLVDAWLYDSKVEVVYTTRKKRHGEHIIKLFITKLGYRFINLLSDIKQPND